MGRKSRIKQDDILDAAERVVSESGGGNLTLDAVAERAKVSKGGLLYTYSNKDALIRAMLDRMLNELNEATNAALAVEGPEPSRLGRALVRGGLGPATRVTPQRTALLAAIANNPALLDGQTQSYRAAIDRVTEEGLSFETGAIVSLATDGLWLLELIGIKPFNTDERTKIIDALCQLATVKPDKDSSCR
jgi:AcrR family transcriptional regulator